MPASQTRERIMNAAESLVLKWGFSATSVDRILESAEVTKGAFFHHFKSKSDLAYALVERYAQREDEMLETNLERAEKLSRDPRQQLLIFIGLLQEGAEQLVEPYPGCLFASYVYEAELFDERTLGIIRDTMTTWRSRFGKKIEEVIAACPPRLPTNAEVLADGITVVFEGSFLLSKTLREPGAIACQLEQFRNYVELLFPPPADAAVGR